MSLLPSWSAAKLLNNNRVSGAFEERLPSCLECHDVVFHGGKKINRFRKHFQFSSKNLKRYWKFFKHNENSGGLFKVFPYTLFVQVIFSRFSSVLFSIYLFPQLFKTLL